MRDRETKKMAVFRQITERVTMSIPCEQHLLSKRKKVTESKIGTGEAAASAFVGQFNHYRFHRCLGAKKLAYNSGRKPKLERSVTSSTACCIIHPALTISSVSLVTVVRSYTVEFKKKYFQIYAGTIGKAKNI
ncbi:MULTISPECIES: hypothetical protein [unclassified Paenibacillus]|uniref:hypothetical protein n=1 Tax=unclassified Paenibacillus TaxID=185978 RepID=UPI002F3EE649